MRRLVALFFLSAMALSAKDAKLDEIGKSPIEVKFVAGGRVPRPCAFCPVP